MTLSTLGARSAWWLPLAVGASACSLTDLDGLSLGAGGQAATSGTQTSSSPASGAASTGAESSTSAPDAASSGQGGDGGAEGIGGAGGDAVTGGGGAVMDSASVASSTSGNGGGGSTSTYADEVLADAPIAYYRFDDPGGVSIAFDEVGSFDGTYGLGVERGIAGAIANDPSAAAGLDGVGDAIVLPDAFDFAPNAPFTVEMWAKSTAATDGYQYLFDKTDGNPRDGYTMLLYTGDGAGLERWAGGVIGVSQLAGPVAVGQWHHFVATYDEAMNVRIYVDASPGSLGGARESLADGPSNAVIGSSSGLSGNFLGGAVDEVAIYDHVLPQSRITAHYLRGHGL